MTRVTTIIFAGLLLQSCASTRKVEAPLAPDRKSVV